MRQVDTSSVVLKPLCNLSIKVCSGIFCTFAAPDITHLRSVESSVTSLRSISFKSPVPDRSIPTISGLDTPSIVTVSLILVVVRIPGKIFCIS